MIEEREGEDTHLTLPTRDLVYVSVVAVSLNTNRKLEEKRRKGEEKKREARRRNTKKRTKRKEKRTTEKRRNKKGSPEIRS